MKLARDLGESVPDTRQPKHGGKYAFEYMSVCLFVMKLNLLHILCAIFLCWGGLGLDNIFFESDALSKLCSVYGFVVI